MSREQCSGSPERKLPVSAKQHVYGKHRVSVSARVAQRAQRLTAEGGVRSS